MNTIFSIIYWISWVLLLWQGTATILRVICAFTWTPDKGIESLYCKEITGVMLKQAAKNLFFSLILIIIIYHLH
jgi:hypothetical protein